MYKAVLALACWACVGRAWRIQPSEREAPRALLVGRTLSTGPWLPRQAHIRAFVRSAVDAPDPVYNAAQRFEILLENDPIHNAREHESTLKREILQDWLSRMKDQEHLTDEMWRSLEEDGEKDIERFASGSLEHAPEGPSPFTIVKDDVAQVASGVNSNLGDVRDGLREASRYLFEEGRLGKQFRSTAVLLMAKAVECNPATEKEPIHSESKLSQLAQITEMIHTASLIHDDVLDDSDQRRGEETIGVRLGIYPAALTGDFLLARASVILARLQNNEVTRIMSGSLEALVTGELVQMRAPKESRLDITAYLQKSYFKTASLIAAALRSIAVLAGHPVSSEIVAAAEAYGFHVGLVFQIVDDILDFSDSEDLGKPAMADVQLGLATAPIIYAAEDFEELKPLILRKFSEKGDVEKAYTMTLKSNGIARARELAQHHANAATKALLMLPPSSARDALERLNMAALDRKK